MTELDIAHWRMHNMGLLSPAFDTPEDVVRRAAGQNLVAGDLVHVANCGRPVDGYALKMPRIRAASAADRAEQVRMRIALWPEADPTELASELEDWPAGDDQFACVAERETGGLCGFVEAGVRPFANGVDEQPCAFVEGWYVDEDVRRTGVGRALIAAVEQWARSRGFSELGSDTEIWNERSQQAHQALGFEERERVVYFRKLL